MKFNLCGILNQTRHLSLLQNKAFVDGEWTEAHTKKTFDVYNPANGKILGVVPDMDVVDLETAINAADRAFKSWADTSAKVSIIYVCIIFSIVSLVQVNVNWKYKTSMLKTFWNHN